jgi:hypothetical protein
MDAAQIIIAGSAAVSAFAAFWIARLTGKLVQATNHYVEETKRYRESAEGQLELLRQQWSYQISPQVFLDFKRVQMTPSSSKLVVYCHNYGRPEIFVSEIEMNVTDEGTKGRLFRIEVKRPLMSGDPLGIDVTHEVREGVMKRSRGRLFSPRGDLLPDPEFEQISLSASRDIWVTFYCLGNRHQIRHSGPLSLKQGQWDVSLPEPEF